MCRFQKSTQLYNNQTLEGSVQLLYVEGLRCVDHEPAKSKEAKQMLIFARGANSTL